MTTTESPQEKPFYLKVKFMYTMMAVAVFLTLALTGTVEFTNGQVMSIILGLLGITSGAHALTDIAAVIGSALRDRGNEQGKHEIEDVLMGPLVEEICETLQRVAAENSRRRGDS